MSLKENIIRLRKEGNSYNEIQKKLKCSKGTISYYLSEGMQEKFKARNRRNIKKNILELKNLYGEKCKLCNYSKCLGALEFHHLNSEEKEFNISQRRGGFTLLAKEAEKCILVCANCHREIHEQLVIDKNSLINIQ